MNLVFWQNTLSLHQAPLIRELAQNKSNRVVVVAESDIGGRRSKMGWGAVDYGDATVVVSPDFRERVDILERERTRSSHIFSGFGVYPATTRTMRKLMRGPHGRIAVVSESWETDGLRGVARTLRYKLAQMWFAKEVDFFFCIGAQSMLQFRRIGVPDERLHPFAYFVADMARPHHAQRISRDVDFLYVGELAPWKDPTSLIRALAILDVSNWHLRMVGEGQSAEETRQLATELGLIERITFLPYQSNTVVRSMMSDSDVLILPSRYDGWGAVASEALVAGTKVVISSAAGASQLVRSEMQGWVFEPGDVSSLADLLASVVRSGGQPQQERSRLAKWAYQVISPRAGAQYLEEVLSAPPSRSAVVRAPWVAMNDSST
jgi:glycosyltransferase involved in cell wall biosynthesis